MRLSDLTGYIYRGLVMARHPEAISLKRRGIDYEHYRNLRRQWLLEADIRTIFDIGANTGQFARLANAVWPNAAIYSFEPLPECFESLKNALPANENFQPLNCALGAAEGTLEFYRAAHSPSSSFLPMTELHEQAFPESVGGQESQPVTIPVKTLDSVAQSLPIQNNVLIKIDVQGYEANVLAGGVETVKRAVAVITETSFRELYEGQPLFDEIYLKMKELGFEFQGNLEQMVSPADGTIVQADSIFVRRDGT